MNEYYTEKFIQQYEHIKKLQLLTDDELNHLKRKRTQFEVSIKSTTELKPFIEYIKYETALMSKFKDLDYENENDANSLDRDLSSHIRDIYRQAIKRFQNDRKLWTHYVNFVKLKFPNSTTNIYQEMLRYHHSLDDYVEAIKYEMDRQNYFVAINFLTQGMSRLKGSKKLISLHIECSLHQAQNDGDGKLKENILLQVTKFYERFLKGSKDINLYINLLQKIQNIKVSRDFQDQIIAYLLTAFHTRPELFNLLANRYLDGIFYDQAEYRNVENIPFEIRLKYALTIFDKSLEEVDEQYKKEMYDIYLTKIEELNALSNLENECVLYIKCAYAKTLISGFEQNYLSEKFFVKYLEMRMVYKEKYRNLIKDIIAKGLELYPHSMNFYEAAIKYYASIKNYDKISELFSTAIKVNENKAVELYTFLCRIYQLDPNGKERLNKAMMEAIESSNKKLSTKFQPYILEYFAITDGITSARDVYTKILNSKNSVNLSIEFFTTMIELEKNELEPDKNIIHNCFERAVTLFGSSNPDVRIKIFSIMH